MTLNCPAGKIAPLMTAAVPDGESEQPRTLRDQQRELTRRRILDAAHKAFTEAGIATTTVDQIARDAGISRATLYLHFSNREAILVELLRRDLRYVQTTFEALPRAVAGGHGPTRDWLSAHAERHSRHRADLRLFSIATATDPVAVELVREHLVRVAGTVLGPGGEAIRSSDPALWTRVILMLMRINQVVASLAQSDPELDPATALDITAAEVIAVLGGR